MGWGDKLQDAWRTIGDGLALAAPTLAGALVNIALPGVGVYAAEGVRMLLNALGVNPDIPDAEKQAHIEKALRAGSPEVLAAIERAEKEFKMAMAQRNIDLEAIFAKDRDSARQRHAAVRDRTPQVLAYITVGGFFAVCGALIVMAVDGQLSAMDAVASGILGTIIGQISARAGDVFSFFFGSSLGSKQNGAELRETVSTLVAQRGARDQG